MGLPSLWFFSSIAWNSSAGNKKLPRGQGSPNKKEMTLGCATLRTLQPRVISVHSWYLTSLVNLSFCSFGLPSLLSESVPRYSPHFQCYETYFHSSRNIPLGRRRHFAQVKWHLPKSSGNSLGIFGSPFVAVSPCVYKIAQLLRKINMETCMKWPFLIRANCKNSLK